MANRKKIIRHQRSSTDQTTVDIGLGKQFRRILRLDAAAVENTQTTGHSAIQSGDLRTNCRMYLLRLSGERGSVQDVYDSMLHTTRGSQGFMTGGLMSSMVYCLPAQAAWEVSHTLFSRSQVSQITGPSQLPDLA